MGQVIKIHPLGIELLPSACLPAMAVSSLLPATLRMLHAAWRGAREALSFSFTRLRQHSGAHLHRIDRYSAADAAALAGQRIESATFRVGGHEWQLHFYPRGVHAASDDASGFSIKLMLRGARDPWWRLLSALLVDVTERNLMFVA